MLLCGVTFDIFSSSIALRLRVRLSQETVEKQCKESFVADAPVERDVRTTSDAQDGPSARGYCDLPRNTQIFFGQYNKLHHADISFP
jgi:hypothetical protein